MKVTSQVEEHVAGVEQAADAEPLRSLVIGRAVTSSGSTFPGVVVGELVGIKDEGRTPLVTYPGQLCTAAIAARSTVDLHGIHVGKQVVLVFDGSEARQPIILGVLRSLEPRPLDSKPGQVEVDADGERLTVTAKDQLVLRCGKASITLTKAGKVLVHGTYVSSRSSGVNRIKGGSVHIN